MENKGEFTFSRARCLWKVNSKKTKQKKEAAETSFAGVVTGNRKPETENKINEIGPAEI